MLGRLWPSTLIFFFFMSYAVSGVAAGVRAPELINNIPYTEVNGGSLLLDASVFHNGPPTPAVILVHGGGWVRGDRRVDVQPLFKPLSDAGFAWFSISYRLATDVSKFGLAINDVTAAIQYVKAHAAEYNIDPDKIALVGESAGGQLAAMAALRDKPGTSVKAVVAFYAPSDLVTLIRNSDYIPARIRDSVQGKPWESLIMAGLSQLSPLDNVRRGMPPFLLIHGTRDSLVPFEQSQEMCDRMREVHASCELYPVEGAGHGIRWWESSPKIATAYKHKMVEWLRREFAAPEPVTS